MTQLTKQVTRSVKVSAKAAKDTVYGMGRNLANFSLQHREMKHVVILTRPRSGSTCLLDLLSMHSNMTTDPHIFYNYTKLPQDFGVTKVHSKKNVRGYKFKVQPTDYDITPENRAQAEKGLANLVAQGIKVIHLERENLVRQAVSWLLADTVKRPNYRKGQKPNTITAMNFDADVLLERIEKFEALAQFEKSVLKNIPHLYLNYEKDLMSEANHAETMSRICQFLEIAPEQVATRYVRLSSDDLSQSILNYQEIQDVLRITKYFEQLSY